MRRATYSVAIGADFAEPYADRNVPIDLSAVKGILSEISLRNPTNFRYVLPGCKTTINARRGAGGDDGSDGNIYLEIETSRRFRVEPDLRDVLDGLSARRRGRRGARHMRYLFAGEED